MANYSVTDAVNLKLDRMDIDLIIGLLDEHIHKAQECSAKEYSKLDDLDGVDRLMAFNSYENGISTTTLRLGLLSYLKQANEKN